jgi:hypothetical protein
MSTSTLRCLHKNTVSEGLDKTLSSVLAVGPGPQVLEARFAKRFTALLSEHSAQLPQDLGERLRIAREQAVERARATRVNPVQAAPTIANFSNVLALFARGQDTHGAGSGWLKLGSLLPLLALVLGLMGIHDWHDRNDTAATAEIDASLLADDLPPSAYGDEGFRAFLKSPRE